MKYICYKLRDNLLLKGQIYRTNTINPKLLSCKPEPWLHTAIFSVERGGNYTSNGGPYGAILVTFVWDTRKVVAVDTINFADVESKPDRTGELTEFSIPFGKYKRVNNDNGAPLQGIDTAKLVKAMKDYQQQYRAIVSKIHKSTDDEYDRTYKDGYDKFVDAMKKGLAKQQDSDLYMKEHHKVIHKIADAIREELRRSLKFKL